MKLKLPIHWEVSMNTEELRKVLEQQERMEPTEFIIPAKHAEYLEFGMPPGVADENPDLDRDILLWVQRKLGITDKAKAKAVAKKVANSLRENGMTARPFWRPAFYYMSDHLQEQFDKGWSLYDIVVDMSNRVNENIEHNVNAPSGREYMPYNGTLQSAWTIRKLTPEEATDALARAENIRPIADRVWKNNDQRRGRK